LLLTSGQSDSYSRHGKPSAAFCAALLSGGAAATGAWSGSAFDRHKEGGQCRSALTEPGAATKAGQEPRPPARLHHFDFYTEDLEATRHFYKDITGLQLRVFWVEPVPLGRARSRS
jgi:hypothetical protein